MSEEYQLTTAGSSYTHKTHALWIDIYSVSLLKSKHMPTLQTLMKIDSDIVRVF